MGPYGALLALSALAACSADPSYSRGQQGKAPAQTVSSRSPVTDAVTARAYVQSPSTTARVVPTADGYVELQIDGTSTPPAMYTLPEGARVLTNSALWAGIPGDMQDFANQGFHLYRVWWRLGIHEQAADLETIVQRILALDPLAKVLIQAAFFPGQDFLVADDLAWTERCEPAQQDACSGSTTKPAVANNPALDCTTCIDHASLVPNAAWVETMKDEFRTLIQFLRDSCSDCRTSVIGYGLSASENGEWMSESNAVRAGDYGVAAAQYFHDWLSEKNGGPTASWYDGGIPEPDSAPSFGLIPLRSERYTKGGPLFLSGARSDKVADHRRSLSDAVSQVILEMAAIAKSETPNLLVGAYYGYELQLAGAWHALVESGHLGMGRVLASPDIDFLSAPVPYNLRPMGNVASFMPLIDSIRLHGKLFMQEEDLRTFAQNDDTSAEHGYTSTLQTSATQVRRDFAATAAKGTGFWYYDMNGGWFDEPALMAEIGQTRAAQAELLSRKPVITSKVAVVFDPESMYTINNNDYRLLPALIDQQRIELGKMGVAYDLLRLADLPVAHARNDYRVVIFLDAFSVDASMRSYLASLKSGNRVLVWLYAPGILDGVDGPVSLTGFALDSTTQPGSALVDITTAAHAFTDGLLGKQYGDLNTDLTPRYFAASTAGTKILGTTQVGGRGQPGLVAKELSGWTSVYSSAPLLPAGLLRNIARAAGVHVFSDTDDVVWAGHAVIGIHAKAAGTRTLKLPASYAVRDPYLAEAGNNVSAGTIAFSFNMSADDARVFFLEPLCAGSCGGGQMPQIDAFSAWSRAGSPWIADVHLQGHDADGSIARYAIDWGNGTVYSYNVNNASIDVNHGIDYLAAGSSPGTYLVKATVEDFRGNVAQSSQTIQVGSPPQVASFTCSQRAGATWIVDCHLLAGGLGSTVAYTIDWGNGTRYGPFTVNGTSLDVTHGLEYATSPAGVYLIGVTVQDDRGASTRASATLQVGAAPQVSLFTCAKRAGTARIADCHLQASAAGQISEYAIDWGNGVQYGPFASNTAGLDVTHGLEYAAAPAQTYVISATVRDDHGAAARASAAVTIGN